MEGDSKLSSWDLTGLEQTVEPNLGSLVWSSDGSECQTSSRMDCSVDLKLGGLGDFGPPEKWRDQSRMSMPPVPVRVPVPMSSPSKRARPPSNASQNVSCSVDGCKADLSNCREYHRRHKVCELHSKTPIVLVSGQEQRFCQQCSRFHLLMEFDEVKRSCRRRLDGHNRRRRKPQPEAINSGSLFPNHQGSSFLTYPTIFPTSISEHNWPGVVKVEEETIYNNQQHLHVINGQPSFPVSFSHGYKEEKHLSFLQDSEPAFTRMTAEATACLSSLKTISSKESSTSKLFSEGLTQVLDSECALSLLSSPTQNSGINMVQIMPADRIPMGQPLVSGLQYSSLGRYSSSQASSIVSPTGFSCSGVEDEQMGTVLVTDTDAILHCQGVFHVAGEGSSAGASQSLHFSWQ